MSGKVFLDSNVLIYLYSSDELEKRKKALDVFEKYDCVTSTQALNEICNVFSKKWKLPTDQIKQAVDEISEACTVVLVDKNTIYAALNIKESTGYSYYDCLMLASAK